MDTRDDRYSGKIFFNAVLPLVRTIIEDVPALAASLKGKSGAFQVSAMTDEGIWATHFIVDNGKVTTALGPCADKPTVELAFKTLRDFNGFMKGTSKKLPAIRGLMRFGILIPFMRALLKMASLLKLKEAPKDEETQRLLVKLYFYLLSSGISQLNREGHPTITEWTTKSPNRVYAWTVDGYEDVAAYLRVKAGKTKAARGRYTRSQPFFTMRFIDLESALATLLGTGDMMELVAGGKMIMEGGPEFGNMLGDYMLLVGSYAQA
jgi:hypothetical protein